MYQNLQNSADGQHTPATIDDQRLSCVDGFTYLGSTLFSDGRLETERQSRMAKASYAFGN